MQQGHSPAGFPTWKMACVRQVRCVSKWSSLWQLHLSGVDVARVFSLSFFFFLRSGSAYAVNVGEAFLRKVSVLERIWRKKQQCTKAAFCSAR